MPEDIQEALDQSQFSSYHRSTHFFYIHEHQVLLSNDHNTIFHNEIWKSRPQEQGQRRPGLRKQPELFWTGRKHGLTGFF